MMTLGYDDDYDENYCNDNIAQCLTTCTWVMMIYDVKMMDDNADQDDFLNQCFRPIFSSQCLPML